VFHIQQLCGVVQKEQPKGETASLATGFLLQLVNLQIQIAYSYCTVSLKDTFAARKNAEEQLSSQICFRPNQSLSKQFRSKLITDMLE